MAYTRALAVAGGVAHIAVAAFVPVVMVVLILRGLAVVRVMAVLGISGGHIRRWGSRARRRRGVPIQR